MNDGKMRLLSWSEIKDLHRELALIIVSLLPSRLPVDRGFVYLLHAKDSSFYKIGKSIEPIRRLKEISPKMPFETRLIHTIETDSMHFVETYLHSKYVDYRANGEWFSLSPEQVADFCGKDCLSVAQSYSSLIWKDFYRFHPVKAESLKNANTWFCLRSIYSEANKEAELFESFLSQKIDRGELTL